VKKNKPKTKKELSAAPAKTVEHLKAEIEERRKAEALLQESEERYGQLFQEMLAGFSLHEIIVDDQGRPVDYVFLAVNPAFERLTGLRGEQIIGKSVTEVLPDIEPYWIETFGQVALSGRPVHFENYSQDLGKYYEVIAFSPRRGQFVANFTDVTERKQAEQALRDSDRHLRILMEQAPVGIFATDMQGRIVDANPKGLELLGLPSKEATLQLNVLNLPSLVSLGLTQYFKKVLETGEPQDIEAEYTSHWGKQCFLRTRLVPRFNARGKQIGSIQILEDITERKEAERVLIEAKEAAEAANKAKNEFLANISHELRTPLHPIIGFTDLVLDSELGPEQRENLREVHNASYKLLGLINDLIELSRLEAEGVRGEHQPFRVEAVLEATVRDLTSEAENRGLKLKKEIASTISEPLFGDGDVLRQILLRLGANAVKFTEEGEVLFSVNEEARAGGTVRLHFRVIDTGVGIPKDQLDRLFEAFTQADGSTTRKYGGLGLGLTLARRWADHLGGRLWAESREGQGTTFHLVVSFGLPAGEA